MTAWTAGRTTGALAIGGAVTAFVGNAIAPRYSGDDVEIYRKIAHSDRYAIAAVVILVALLLVTAAFVGISRRERARPDDLLEYARVAAIVGGAIALVQIGVELYGYRQAARSFASANTDNVVPAFWATNALDHTSAAMFATWTIVLLGVAPLLLGWAQLRSGATGRFGVVAIVGGAICVVVGFASLLKSDQSTFDIPFAIGSVIVTIWLLLTGIALWRNPQSQEIDLAESRQHAKA